MNKKEIFNHLIENLKDNLETLINSANSAKDAATNEESKAENKYDTRGLEASYLAGAQAKRAQALSETIGSLLKLKVKNFEKDEPIAPTALILTENHEGIEKWFFMLPSAGGEKIEYNNKTIHTITTTSPIGLKLLGKTSGEIIEMNVKNTTTEYEILKIY